MISFLKKSLISISTLALVVTALPVANNALAEDSVEVAVTYNFANNTKGLSKGTIALNADAIAAGSEESYEVYWGDGEGNKLTKDGVEYTAIHKFDSTDAYDGNAKAYKYDIASDYAAIPEGAKEIFVLDEDEDEVTSFDIPESKQSSLGEATTEFALMSDVHYNRYPSESEAAPEKDDFSVLAYNNALNFVDARGIKKVFLAGDLSNQGEIDAYKKFNKANNNHPNLTVYTCMGNHDVSWTKSSTKMVTQFMNNVNTKKNNDVNVVKIAPNNLDFVYKDGENYFIMFSQVRARYSKNNYLVEDEQLDWLHRTLNSLADKNVYLLLHTYLANYDGRVDTAVGNLKNPAGYTYNLTYPFGALDEVRLRGILNQYSNVTMISGHSHWAYDQIKYNPNLVIGNVNKAKSGATLLHLSSVGAPRTIEPSSTQRIENYGVLNTDTGEIEQKRSEGTIATKYANSTVYTGADFMSGKYLGYSIYLAADGQKHAPEADIKLAKSKITKVGKVKKISKKSKKYKVKIKYKKINKRYKYQVQYSTSSTFKKSNKNKYTTSTSYTITKLKRKTKYYIRVRAYAYQFGARVNGAWSAKKKIKTKK